MHDCALRVCTCMCHQDQMAWPNMPRIASRIGLLAKRYLRLILLSSNPESQPSLAAQVADAREQLLAADRQAEEMAAQVGLFELKLEEVAGKLQ